MPASVEIIGLRCHFVAETLILSGLQEDVQRFEREFEAGFVPSGTATRSPTKTAGNIASQLLEAENTLEDLAAEDTEPENRPEKVRQRGLSPPFLLLTLLVIRGTCNSRLRSHWRECSVICSTQRVITTGFTQYFTHR